MKTGQSTTSFHPATGNPIMTSTTYNRSVAHATEGSKTGFSLESLGEMNDSSKSKGDSHKGWGIRTLLALQDLLPRTMRIKKGRRIRGRRWYGWRTELLAWRINWKAINKRKFMNKLGLRSGK